MLYVYYGFDINSARDKLAITIDNLLSKNPDALYIHITDENVGSVDFAELVSAQALFKNEYIVLLDSLLDSDVSAELVDFIEDFSNSSNLFFLLDKDIDASTLADLSKHAKKVQEFKLSEPKIAKKKDNFNLFSITDAFGERNKKKLWLLFTQAKMNSISDEEIHGVLFWIVKSMILSSYPYSATELGMKPFVLNKSRKFAKNFKSVELQEFLKSLLKMPHDARRVAGDLGVSLEKFILSI